MNKFIFKILVYIFISNYSSVFSQVLGAPAISIKCSDLKNLKFEPTTTSNWNGWGNDLNQSRYQNFNNSRISIQNVASLKLKWVYGFPGTEKMDSQPTIFGGLVFTSAGKNKIYALDAKTGCIVWERSVNSRVRSTVQVGKVNEQYYLFFGDMAGTSYALSAVDGKIIWQKKIESHVAAQITGSSIFYDGIIYFPVASGEEGWAIPSSYQCCTFRGSIVAQNAANGDVLWKSYTIPVEPQKTSKNAKGVQNYGPSGAAIWSSPVIDPIKNVLYATTGNNYSSPANDSSDAFIAFDLKTGTILWKKQITSNDSTNMSCYENDSANCPSKSAPDHDFSSSPILVTLENRRLLVAGQKSGVVTAIDPDDNGKIIWQNKISRGGSLGGIQWGSAFSQNTLFVPVSDLQTVYVTSSTPGAQKGIVGWYKFSKNSGSGLVALDVLTGKIKWNSKSESCNFDGCSSSNSAAVTALDDVIFSGSVDGRLRAYEISNGKKIWDIDTKINFDKSNGTKAYGGSLDGPGVTVSDGMVFVNSGYRMFGGVPGNALLAFSID